MATLRAAVVAATRPSVRRAPRSPAPWPPGGRNGGPKRRAVAVRSSIGTAPAPIPAHRRTRGAPVSVAGRWIRLPEHPPRRRRPLDPCRSLRYLHSRTPLGNSLTVEQRTLTPSVLVRIQVPQPSFPIGTVSAALGRANFPNVSRVVATRASVRVAVRGGNRVSLGPWSLASVSWPIYRRFLSVCVDFRNSRRTIGVHGSPLASQTCRRSNVEERPPKLASN